MNPDDIQDHGEYRCPICHGLLDGFDCPRCKKSTTMNNQNEDPSSQRLAGFLLLFLLVAGSVGLIVTALIILFSPPNL